MGRRMTGRTVKRLAQGVRGKRIASLLLAGVMLLICLSPDLAYATGGETAVGTWEQLKSIADHFSGTIRLTADIDAGNEEWAGLSGFSGAFYGDGHTISRLNVTGTGTGTGLFATTAAGAEIRDLIISNSSFTGTCLVGAVVGRSAGALTMTDVRVTDDVTVTADYQLGGLIGRAEANVSLTDCWSASSVVSVGTSAENAGQAGGLIGWVHSGAAATVTGCLYSGTITRATYNNYGGLVGAVYGGSPATVRIVSSVSTVAFAGSGGRCGGFVGGVIGGTVNIELVNDYSGYATNSAQTAYGAVGDNAVSSLNTEGEGYNYWASAYAVGSNTASKAIAYPAQLIGYALASKNHNFNGKTLTLNNDIDLTGWGDWPMLGNGATLYFMGSFNGNGKTLSGLHVAASTGNIATTDQPVGLVGILNGAGASVRDLTISNSTFTSDAVFVGAAAGCIYGGATVSGVRVTSSVSVSGFDQVGGIVGAISTNSGGTVTQCWSEAAVSLRMESARDRSAGGVAGSVLGPNGVIRNCLFTGTVNASDAAVGGILGSTRNDNGYATIAYCVSAGRLTGVYVGGILGDFSRIYLQNWDGDTYPQTYAISNCYAAPANKAVGSLSVGFTDTWVSNTTIYNSISALYGNTCAARLDGEIWHFRANDVPKPEVFYSDSLPYTANSTAAAESRMPKMTVREAFADVPAPPAGMTLQEESNVNLGCFVRLYTWDYSGNPLPAYYNSLTAAGFTLYSGSPTQLASGHDGVYAFVMEKGERYLFVRYYGSGSGLSVGVAPKSADQVLDGETLFSGVPAPGAADAVDYGDSNFLKTYTGKTESDYYSLCASLENSGFTGVAYNGVAGLYNGKVRTSSYTKEDRTVTVIYSAQRGEIYLSVGQNEPISPHLNNADTWAADTGKYDETVMVMPALTTKGNSFVFRLKNGHFIINDGGTMDDAENLVTLLEHMTPHGKPVVEGWFVSHGHMDHCGTLAALSRDPLLRERIRVDGIYYSGISIATFALDPGAVGASRSVAACASLLRTSGGDVTPVYRNHTGERYYFSDISVDVIMTQEQTPMSAYLGTINDSSTWISVNVGEQSILLAGDGDWGQVDVVESFYGDMTFTMRSLLHHGYNETPDFLEYCTADTILDTYCEREVRAALRPKASTALETLASDASLERINYDEDRWFTFPYVKGSYQMATDISAYRSGEVYTAPIVGQNANTVFAGWYWDIDLTVPVGKDDVTGGAFPRYVDEDVLQVKYQQDENEYAAGNRKVRVITTVDNLDYEKVGFELTYVNSKGTTVTKDVAATKVYARLNWFKDNEENYYTPASEFSSVSTYFCGFILNAGRAIVANNLSGFSARAYWTTADGTKVYGGSRDDLKFYTSGLDVIVGDGDTLELD